MKERGRASMQLFPCHRRMFGSTWVQKSSKNLFVLDLNQQNTSYTIEDSTR